MLLSPSMFLKVLASRRWIVCTALVSLVMMVVCDTAGSQETSLDAIESNRSIDVKTEIWPLFQSRCLRCHGPASDGSGDGGPAGGFRIDTLEGIQSGGHTGNAMLGESGELLQRLVSTDEDYRMPKGEPSLSNSQIARIRSWIQAGAPWPEEGVISFPKVGSQSPVISSTKRGRPVWENVLDALEDAHEKLRWLLIPMTIFLVAVLLLERRKKRLLQQADDQATASGLNQNPFDRLALASTGTHYLSAYLGIVLLGLAVYHIRRIEELNVKLETARINVRSTVIDSSRVGDRGMGTQLYRPPHPRRLGGVYYRGNDERNEKLFNGGYYRTATMTLSLRDQDNRVIRWGDPLDATSAFVHLAIEKAPFATPDLFNERVFEGCYLSSVNSEDSIIDDSVNSIFFSPTDSPERWEANYKLSGPLKDKTLSGRIYLNNHGTAHFGIQYEIHFDDGNRVSEASELWMGPILLPGGVLVPRDNEIPLAQWFDFLPIPEITEKNSDDPELLGIPENARNGL